jgi:hypothetical protein
VLVQAEILDLLFELGSDIWNMLGRLSPVRIPTFAGRMRESEWFGHGLSVMFGGFSHDPRSVLTGILWLALVFIEGGANSCLRWLALAMKV